MGRMVWMVWVTKTTKYDDLLVKSLKRSKLPKRTEGEDDHDDDHLCVGPPSWEKKRWIYEVGSKTTRRPNKLSKIKRTRTNNAITSFPIPPNLHKALLIKLVIHAVN